MDFKYKKYIDNSLIYIIFAVLILIFIIGFLFFRSHNEKSKLEDLGRTISEINLTYDFSEDSITSEDYVSSIENKLEKLQETNSALKSLKVSQKHQNLSSPLKDGLDKNIELFNKLLSILKTPDALNIPDEYAIASKLKKECENYYSICRSNLIPVYLYKEGNNYLQDIFYYINELIKTNRDKGFVQSQKNDFVVSMKSLLLKPANLIKESNRDLKVLVTDIENKLSSLQELKNNLYSLPIPEQANDSFLALENALKSYDKYINYFYKGLLNEIENKKTPEDYYDKSSILFDEFIYSLESAEKSLDNYNKN